MRRTKREIDKAVPERDWDEIVREETTKQSSSFKIRKSAECTNAQAHRRNKSWGRRIKINSRSLDGEERGRRGRVKRGIV